MAFEQRLGAAWSRHADEPDAVYAEALALCEEAPAAQLAGAANLVFHVGGEHLGRFATVKASIEELLPRAEDPAVAAPLHRLLAACALCDGGEAEAHLSRAAGDAATNRAIALGLAASALAGLGRTREAASNFEAAIALAEASGAHRSIAATANNLAAGLEQRPARAAEDDALMLRAAEVARVAWEKAGTWMNVERAEYRLAMTRLARGEAALAAEHARRVLAIVEANGGDPGEAFFGWEALARAQAAAGSPDEARTARDAAAEALGRIADEGFRAYCVKALETLDARLRPGG